jgi:hypothetical protein
MEQRHSIDVTAVPQQPNDSAKLIRKLRWIGMEEEAYRLQVAVRSLPPEERDTVSAGPFSTD